MEPAEDTPQRRSKRSRRRRALLLGGLSTAFALNACGGRSVLVFWEEEPPDLGPDESPLGSGGESHSGGNAMVTGGATMTGGRPGSGGETPTSGGGMGGSGDLCGEFSCDPLGDCSMELTEQGTCERRCNLDATLTSNDDVAALAALKCEILQSNLLVKGSEISTLAGLETIRSVEGDLFILDATELSDLKGLSGLRLITQNLSIQSTELNSLAGLESLTWIGSGLELYLNWNLIDLSALSGLSVDNLTVYITANPVLGTLRGLEGITSTKNCTVAANDNLLDLRGLHNIQTIDGSLVVATNPQVLAMDFPELSQVTGSLAMTGQRLSEQADLLSLQSVGEDLVFAQNGVTELPFHQLERARSLTITGNENLVTLEGLSDLETLEQLRIGGNSLLPQCEVNAFSARFGFCTECVNNNLDAQCTE